MMRQNIRFAVLVTALCLLLAGCMPHSNRGPLLDERGAALAAVEREAPGDGSLDWTVFGHGVTVERRDRGWQPRRYAEAYVDEELGFAILNWSGFAPLEAWTDRVSGLVFFNEELTESQIMLRIEAWPQGDDEEMGRLIAGIDLEEGSIERQHISGLDELETHPDLDAWLLGRVLELRDILIRERVLAQRRNEQLEIEPNPEHPIPVVIEDEPLLNYEFLSVELKPEPGVQFSNPRELYTGSTDIITGMGSFRDDLWQLRLTLSRLPRTGGVFPDIGELELDIDLQSRSVQREPLDEEDEDNAALVALTQLPDEVFLSFADNLRREVIEAIPRGLEILRVGEEETFNRGDWQPIEDEQDETDASDEDDETDVSDEDDETDATDEDETEPTAVG